MRSTFPSSPVAFHYERVELTREIVLWAMYERPSNDEWRQMFGDVTEWLLDLERRGRRVSVVVDPSGMGNVDAHARAFAGQWRADHLPLIAEFKL